MLIGVLMAAGGRPAQAGLATAPIGRISGEVVLTGSDGVRHATAAATVSWNADSGSGDVRIEINQAGVTLSAVTARYTAETEQEAVGAVTALVLAVTDRGSGGQTSLRLSDIRFEGDSQAFRGLAAGLIEWWDAKASLAIDDYVSPAPSLAQLGKLQLNGWGHNFHENAAVQSLAIVLFDGPGQVAGGHVTTFDTSLLPDSSCDIVAGSLTEIAFTPTPGDFELELTFDTSSPICNSPLARARLAITVLADGTIDVRGISNAWITPAPYVTLEGTGNAKFVAPSGQ
jgi:hypothetical protein